MILHDYLPVNDDDFYLNYSPSSGFCTFKCLLALFFSIQDGLEAFFNDFNIYIGLCMRKYQ